MARPTTRSVVREEIAALTPALAEAIAKILGANVQTVSARVVAAPAIQPAARKAAVEPVFQPKARPQRGTWAKRERIEKAPEGGYADRVTVVPSNRGDQPRPSIRGFSSAQIEEILSQNVNVYFFRSSDDVSIQPVKQVRDELLAAGFRFTMAPRGFARWYGPLAKLPATFKGAIERS